MSLNLMDMVKSAVGDQVLKQMGGILGEGEDKTRSAMNSALPAILGGLIKKASNRSGADEIFSSLDDNDGGILDDLGGMLSGDGKDGLLKSGGGILKMLFGPNQSGLISTLSKLSGIGSDSAGSLLGMLAPIVMGVLGRQQSKQGLDVSGLTNMLMSQKNLVADQLPKELSGQLGIGDLLSSGTNAVNEASSAANAAAQEAKGGFGKLLVPIIAIAGLGLLAFNFFRGGVREGVEGLDMPEISVPSVSMPDMPQLSIPGLPEGMTELPAKLTETLGGVTSAISGITNEATASTAATKIEAATQAMSGFGLDKLPAAAKSSVASAIGPLANKLKSALESAYAIPGVRGILEPAVQPMLEMVAGISG